MTRIVHHLYCFGFDRTYENWILHGEETSSSGNLKAYNVLNDVTFESHDNEDDIYGMLNDLRAPINKNSQVEDEKEFLGFKFQDLFNEIEKELYTDCKKFSILIFIFKLKHVKVTDH